jgi:septation ring formation regulator EzrA
MSFIAFLIESADELAAAGKHVARCSRGYKAAIRAGNKELAAQWDEEWDTAREQWNQLKAAARKSALKESANIDQQISDAEKKLKNAKFDLAHPEEGTRTTQFSALEDAVEQLTKQVKVLKDRKASLSKPVNEAVDWAAFKLEHYVEQYGFSKASAHIQAAHDLGRISDEKAASLMSQLSRLRKRHGTTTSDKNIR